MIPSDEGNGDGEESGAAGKSIFVVVLVTEDVVDAAHPGDHARERERAQPDAADADSAVPSRVRLETDGAKVVAGASAEVIKTDRHRQEHRHEECEIGGGTGEDRVDGRDAEPTSHR